MKGHNTNITVNAHKYERATNDYYTREGINALCMDAQRNDDGYYDDTLYVSDDDNCRMTINGYVIATHQPLWW